MTKITKKNFFPKTKNTEKSNKEIEFHMFTEESQEFRLIMQSKRSKNDDLIYKFFSMQPNGIMSQDQFKIDNLKRKFDDLFRIIEEHFRKTIEFYDKKK